MAEPSSAPDANDEVDPKTYFVGDLLPSNAGENEEEPLTWEQVDAAADHALGVGDQIARSSGVSGETGESPGE